MTRQWKQRFSLLRSYPLCLPFHENSKKSGGRGENTQVRFCFAKFVIRHFESQVNDKRDIRVPLILPLLRNPALLGTGEPLEWLIRIALVWRISQTALFCKPAAWSSCFPFFAKSFLKDQPLPEGNINISYLPIMTTDARIKTPVNAQKLEVLMKTPQNAWKKKVCKVVSSAL